MSYAVIIPSKTIGNLVPCVEAVRTHEPDAHIVVVDDGVEWNHPKHQPFEYDLTPETATTFIPGIKPFVFARAINQGIRAAGTDDVVILNDDTLLQTPGGFTALQQALTDHPEFGIISATTNCAGNPRQYPMGIGLREERETVAFVCVLVPRCTIETVGLLDERFVTYGWEDNDYCRRVMLAGLKIGIHDGCFIDHRSLRSTFRGLPGAAGSIEPGRRIFNAKWGIA